MQSSYLIAPLGRAALRCGVKRRIRFALGALSILVLATPAAAIDTWEVYPMGPSVLEVYGIRYGHGAEEKADRGLALMLGPAWGLSSTTHAYAFAMINSSDELEGGLELMSLGLFHNLLDRSLKLDLFGELIAHGDGLRQVGRLLGTELNLDGSNMGLFGRGAWVWSPDGANAAGEAVVGRELLLTEGIYIKMGAKTEMLAEWRQVKSQGFQSRETKWRSNSYAFGFNSVVSRYAELILEARRWEPASASAETWSFTVGFVTVWQ